MRLHKWYKCEHCPEFHPFELDSFVKNYVVVSAEANTQAEANDGRPKEYFRYTILLRLLETTAPDKIWQYFQLLDQNNANLMACTNNNAILTADEIKMWSNSHKMFEEEYHVVKCAKAGQRICARKWQNMLEETEQPFMAQAVELFKSGPNEQWMEIFGLKLHVKPLWFTGTRVYQFFTRVLRSCTSTRDFHRFDCTIFVNGKFSELLTFDLRCSIHYKTEMEQPGRELTIEDIKPFLLTRSITELGFTGGLYLLINPIATFIKELRLCYYAHTEKPRAWIRCPIATEEDLPGATPVDLAPIHSGCIELRSFRILNF